MANVIIGIHGIGNKPKKEILEKWWKQAIIEGLKSNNFKTNLPKFELVYWADILHDKPLNENEKNTNSPDFLDEKYVKAPEFFETENHSARQKIIKFLGDQLNKIFLNPDFSLNYTYITDAIVSRYFKDLEIYYTENCTLENENICKAKVLIKQRLIDTLEKYKSDNIMLISHSMGSIIAFDVLTFEAPLIPINTFVTMGSPLGIPIVISKIASEQKQRHIIDNHMITPESVSKYWYNFSDILDKVAFNYKLDDDFSQNKVGVKPTDFLVVNNYEINGHRNPHKSFGYLRTPEFAKILNDFNLSEKLSIKEKIIRRFNELVKALQPQFSK